MFSTHSRKNLQVVAYVARLHENNLNNPSHARVGRIPAGSCSRSESLRRKFTGCTPTKIIYRQLAAYLARDSVDNIFKVYLYKAHMQLPTSHEFTRTEFLVQHVRYLQAAVHVARVSEVLDARKTWPRQRAELSASLRDLVEVVRLVQLDLQQRRETK